MHKVWVGVGGYVGGWASVSGPGGDMQGNIA
jgi:hypothetical protein